MYAGNAPHRIKHRGIASTCTITTVTSHACEHSGGLRRAASFIPVSARRVIVACALAEIIHEDCSLLANFERS